MNESIKEQLESTFKAVVVNILEDSRIVVDVKKEQVLTVLKFLKDRNFDHLALVSCVDWIEEKEFELVYILTGYMQGEKEYTGQERLHLIVKTRISRQSPQFETVTGIFQNAEPYEREIHELFGVKFEGHKRLTPLFLERDYEIPPFRKDFDTRQYVQDVFDKIPFVENNDK
ncbi:MAG: NADH-quinone oxidoreductase subunit C [Candidatus Omnitrophica bacterium]|nr:NADH-quinone oxidoreductase subunit C [Candidatus Omnitrophota bacterium]